MVVKLLNIKSHEIDEEFNNNIKQEENKIIYKQGINELNNSNYKEAISILSTVSSSSLYYQKAQKQK
jgi:outer membrane protein assembly factor BamD (BamD/ComL family)